MNPPTLGDLSAEPIPVEQLLLDPHNPRLANDTPGGITQPELAIEMAAIFEALAVARSIASFGFYPWEALVVVPEENNYVVVEGNRRLTAVIGLARAEIRAEFEDQEQWTAVALQAGDNIPTSLPCVVVASREDATPALGYRHISGIKPWEPQRQAAFVTHLVREQGKTFEEVAVLTGQTESWVRTTYRDFSVFEDAAGDGVDVSQAIESYSLVTVMLGKQSIREHLGVKKKVDEGASPFEQKDTENVAEVFEWVFGTAEAEPVVTDSRQITTLAKVVGNPVGLAALRDGASLDQAQQDVDVSEYDPSEIIVKELGRAAAIVRSLDLGDASDHPEVQSRAEDLAEAVGDLLNSLDSPAP